MGRQDTLEDSLAVSRDEETAAPPHGLGIGGEDPLLECLEFLTRHHGRPRTGEVLKAGLPDSDGPLMPRLFVRAAERAGFRARVVRRRLAAIGKHVLPAVLILDEGRASVLLEYAEGAKIRVFSPETGGAVELLDIDDLKDSYTGYVILVRPEARLGIKDGADDIPRPRAWFWGTISRNWWSYVQVLVAAALINLFALTTPLFIMTVYDRVIPNNAFETLYVLALGVGMVLGFDFLMKSLRGYFIDAAGKRADVMLACRIFDQVLDMRVEAKPASAGAFANTLREFETIRDFFTSATLATFVDLPFIVLFIAVIWLISGPVALVLAVAVPVVLFFGMLIQIPLNVVVRRNLREAEHKHGVLVETISGLETIKSIGAEGRMRRLWEDVVGLTASSSQKSRALSLSAVNFAALVQQLTSVDVVVYGVHLVAAGEMTVGALIACVILGSRAIAPLGQVAQLLTRFHQSMVSLKALDRLMNSPVERPPSKSFLHRPTLKGAIAFNDVGFTYPERDTPALIGVGFTIGAGERVGLIGRVGSGKSTVAKLILGLFEPSAGAITIDGTDIRQIDPIDLRKAIGYVPQDQFLFRGTIHDNITAAAPHADDDAALRAAGLAGIDDFVNRNPLGYDVAVGERGEGISGGQHQAVTIARALIRDPGILVLDEPTNAMDSRSESALARRLGEYLSGRTLVLMTHRASLLPLVDRVIVLDDGRVVADGPRAKVMEALAAGRIGAVRPR